MLTHYRSQTIGFVFSSTSEADACRGTLNGACAAPAHGSQHLADITPRSLEATRRAVYVQKSVSGFGVSFSSPQPPSSGVFIAEIAEWANPIPGLAIGAQVIEINGTSTDFDVGSGGGDADTQLTPAARAEQILRDAPADSTCVLILQDPPPPPTPPGSPSKPPSVRFKRFNTDDGATKEAGAGIRQESWIDDGEIDQHRTLKASIKTPTRTAYPDSSAQPSPSRPVARTVSDTIESPPERRGRMLKARQRSISNE